MALLPCPECQKDVSDKASTCPHCGMPLGAELESSSSVRRRRLSLLGGALLLALFAGGGLYTALRRPDYSLVEELRAEQDVRGTHDEHVRQRFFRLYTEHPTNAMYVYLWTRCVDDPAKQLELAEQGIHADPRFSWNYNMAARTLSRLNRVPQAYEAAVKGAALDPANMQLADKRAVLKVVLDHKLSEQAKPAPNGYTSYEGKEHLDKAARYEGLFHGLNRAPDRADLQAIEKSRLPDHKGPVSDAIKGFVLCANPVADTCLRIYVPGDAKLGSVWPHPGAEVTAFKDNQLVAVAGSVVTNGRGENIMLADSVTVEAP